MCTPEWIGELYSCRTFEGHEREFWSCANFFKIFWEAVGGMVFHVSLKIIGLGFASWVPETFQLILYLKPSSVIHMPHDLGGI